MDEFRKAVEHFLRESCGIFAHAIAPQQLYVALEQGGGGLSQTRIAYWQFAEQYWPLVSQLATHRRIVEISLGDSYVGNLVFATPFGTSQGDGQGKISWLSDSVLKSLVAEYLRRNNGGSYNETLAVAIVQEFVSEIESQQWNCVEVIVLTGIKITVDQVELYDNIKPIPVSENNIEHYWNEVNLLSQLMDRFTCIRLNTCVIEVVYIFTLNNPITNEAIASLGQKRDGIITALSLLTNSNIRAIFAERQARSLRWNWLNPLSLTKAASSDETTNIDALDASQITALVDQLESSPNLGRLAVALRRWSSGINKGENEDRLIDMWIALESLFAPDGGSEISYRISLRIAAFLGSTPDERKDVFDIIRHSYAWRSAVVHGSTANERTVNKLWSYPGLVDSDSLRDAVETCPSPFECRR